MWNLPPALVDLELAGHLESPPLPGRGPPDRHCGASWLRVWDLATPSRSAPKDLLSRCGITETPAAPGRGHNRGPLILGAWLSTSRGAQRLSATSTVLARLIRSNSGDSLRRGTKNHKVCDDDVGVRWFRAGRFGARVGYPSRARLRLSAAVSLVPRGFLGPRLGLQLGGGRLPRRLSPR